MKPKFVFANLDEQTNYLSSHIQEVDHPFPLLAPESQGIYYRAKPTPVVKNKNKIKISFSEESVVVTRWIQVDFDKKILFKGFKVVTHFPVIPASYENITVQASADGSSFKDLESFTPGVVRNKTVELTSPVETQYFRLYIYQLAESRCLKVKGIEIYH